MKYPSLLLLIAITFFSCTSHKKNTNTVKLGKISTPYGELIIWLYDETPNHKASFIQLTEENYWDDFSFNRVIKDFVIQGGCPDTPEGFSSSPYLVEPEFSKNLNHVYGAVGAGRDNNPEKRSASCQFYIVNDKKGIPRLDGDYTIFGQVITGFDVLEKISSVETDSLNMPIENIPMDVSIVSMRKKDAHIQLIHTL